MSLNELIFNKNAKASLVWEWKAFQTNGARANGYPHGTEEGSQFPHTIAKN